MYVLVRKPENRRRGSSPSLDFIYRPIITPFYAPFNAIIFHCFTIFTHFLPFRFTFVTICDTMDPKQQFAKKEFLWKRYACRSSRRRTKLCFTYTTTHTPLGYVDERNSVLNRLQRLLAFFGFFQKHDLFYARRMGE